VGIRFAADLSPGDTVQIVPGDQRTVARIEWPDTYVAAGVQAVRVWWTDRARPSLLAADKELPLVRRAVEDHPGREG
jgi:hypothetical protein